MSTPPSPDGVPAFLDALRTHLAAERPWADVPAQDGAVSDSAVLALISGTSLDDAAILIEERAHTMRSQPAQFALPGGRRDPGDATAEATAVRETWEEVGLSADRFTVLGALPPVVLALRDIRVVPVIAWMPSVPASLTLSEAEVHRVLCPPLRGPGSLSDPAVVCWARAMGRSMGEAYDLPQDPDDPDDDAFVWGFTAGLLKRLLAAIDPSLVVEPTEERPVPAYRVWRPAG
ncbi:CoA pyrophosphatase [Helcobacillus massiliensis]|uniref:NUDIX hydrolase n=1 Tax=Helcobacillus massiliensis TaxID=521392 RepID=UPI0021A2DAAC|nr:CoA pyrophosphatase [Helcobacillus massiliensis]MCT1556628.1 CoA pyrophosphatase [Helcobacillus massiliensis]MCT2035822.1 CoA pyrophosphatase [Helcobacillus massiliensis]MCT2331096.1 CoA pyrophosphatase [Helcobacillus massiliensis]